MWIRAAALTLAAATVVAAQDARPSEHVAGVGGLIRTVADLDRSVAFYRDTLGLTFDASAGNRESASAMPDGSPELLRLYTAGTARARSATARVGSGPMHIELIEFSGVDRRAASRRLQDPGASRLLLTVRDIDAAVIQARFSGATLLSEGDAPVAMVDERGNARAVLLQDPDGFFVQLTQRAGPIPADAAGGNLLDASVGLTVDDMDRTMRLFRDVLGFEMKRDPEDNDDARLAMMGVFTAFYRRVLAVVPGTNLELELLEVHGLDRRHGSPRPFDPGTATLQLRTPEVPRAVSALAAAGASLVSEGGTITLRDASGARPYAMLSTPDRFFLQLAGER